MSAAGFDSGATVSSGGKLVVASGGTEVDATVRAGGSAVVSSGGVAELIGSGTTSGVTLLSGAALGVGSGYTLTSFTVSKGITLVPPSTTLTIPELVNAPELVALTRTFKVAPAELIAPCRR